MFHKKTIKDVPIHDKKVLVRVDYNVPLETSKDGTITIADDYRIEKSLPTIKYLLERNCSVVLMSHLGRPKGKVVKELSLAPVAARLAELLQAPVAFVPEVIGAQASQAIKKMQPGSVVLLENLRFEPAEKSNDDAFAQTLAGGFDYFVQNAFGVVHRKDASVDAIARHAPSVAGLLVETEVATIQKAISTPKKPVVAVVGGAKIAGKIDMLHKFISLADTIIIGGAMANTFLVAMGHDVGKSLYDKDELGQARSIREAAHAAGTELILPIKDVAISKEVKPDEQRKEIDLQHVGTEDIILDFGADSIQLVIDAVEGSGTVIWNGPLGMTELMPFAWASERLAHYIADHHTDSIVGGGDTAAFIADIGLLNSFTHVSTGGGASLELMSGKPLPGVEALMDK